MISIDVLSPNNELNENRRTLGFFNPNYIVKKSYEFEHKYVQVFFDELPLAVGIRHEDKLILPFRDYIMNVGDMLHVKVIENNQITISKKYLFNSEGILKEVFN